MLPQSQFLPAQAMADPEVKGVRPLIQADPSGQDFADPESRYGRAGRERLAVAGFRPIEKGHRGLCGQEGADKREGINADRSLLRTAPDGSDTLPGAVSVEDIPISHQAE